MNSLWLLKSVFSFCWFFLLCLFGNKAFVFQPSGVENCRKPLNTLWLSDCETNARTGRSACTLQPPQKIARTREQINFISRCLKRRWWQEQRGGGGGGGGCFYREVLVESWSRFDVRGNKHTHKTCSAHDCCIRTCVVLIKLWLNLKLFF